MITVPILRRKWTFYLQKLPILFCPRTFALTMSSAEAALLSNFLRLDSSTLSDLALPPQKGLL
jgi:hypothetical protein